MPVRARAVLTTALFVAATVLGGTVAAPPVAAGGEKVVIIVGPVGSLTNTYRSMANGVANAATAAGASVVKVYSPSATWINVRNAVAGANVIVYFGHGNGFPNPYSSTENPDRVNGWGLNRTTTNGDADQWDSTMVYCGEKALLGTLTASDGIHQRNYCGYPDNDGIAPAPGFTMIYAQAHYAPGFGERYVETDPEPTLSEGQQRVRNYSYPVLALGASGYIATAYGDADDIVTRVLTQPDRTFGDIFRDGEGYTSSALRTMAHPDIASAEVWVQKTALGSLHFGDPDYWYAFAGNPNQTPSGALGVSGVRFTDIGASSFQTEILWLADSGITAGCSATRFCPTSPVTREQMASFLARALKLAAANADYFTDDGASQHHENINRVAQAAIASGCATARFCPGNVVTRAQMASFLARALGLPATGTDFFADDNGTTHEGDINRLAASGITTGCAAGRYCPDNAVTREQMAAFLYRAFGP